MTATAKRPRRDKDTEEVVGGVRRQIRSLEMRAANEDPWVIEEMVQLQAELEAATIRTVARLRKAGYTWNDIGFNLGLNAVQAHKRFAHKIAAIEV